ncbi:hypothetical protein M0R01_04455 [bacterium]|jgi:hypothetical protein|nr:hypothetical protein [bacterium]
MPILVSDFPSLTDDLQSIFNEVAKNKVAENVGFSIFNVFDTDRLTYDHLILHGVSGIKRVTSGQDLPKLSAREGDSVSWTQEYFGAEVDITKKMRKFDLHNQIDSVVRSITEDAFDKIDQSLADRIIQGWGTSYTDVYGDTVSALGPDGLALFTASHTTPINSDVFSNIISDGTNTNPPLSRQAIVYMRAQGLKHRDPNNLVRSINYDTIIVTADNEDIADRICNSEYLPGSANNDKNPLKGKVKVIVWPRLALASDGTDSSAYWFMCDSKGVKESLQCLFAERPALDAPEQVYANKNWAYSLDFFYAIGMGFPAYIAGSKGDKS